MLFKVINLKRISKQDLQFDPKPISEWPTKTIDVEENKSVTCIASWHWDVHSVNEISNNLSECTWDALTLGFRYMLCDIVSLDQKSGELSSILISYSKFYSSLHSVISYRVDDDLKRPWLVFEACNILNSPTYLGYLYHKWKLRVPLIFSLLIKQIALRRLGISAINEERLYLCDTKEANYLRVNDLGLLNDMDSDRMIKIINLDRQDQTYSSDCLLIYELSSPKLRNELIGDLKKLESNSIIIPSLTIIWGMFDGLSISIRGCDWEIYGVIEWTLSIIEANKHHLPEGITFEFDKQLVEFTFRSRSSEDKYRMEIQKPSERLALYHKYDDLLCRFRDKDVKSVAERVKTKFLKACLEYSTSLLRQNVIKEPGPLSEDHPRYRLIFEDNYHK